MSRPKSSPSNSIPTNNASAFTRVSATPMDREAPVETLRVHGNHSPPDRVDTSSDPQILSDMRRRLAESSGQLQDAGWLIELVQSMMSVERFPTAAHELTTQMQSRLNVVRVVLGWQGSQISLNRKHPKIVSVSGVANLDGNSEEMRSYQGCLDEAVTRQSIGLWPPRPVSVSETESEVVESSLMDSLSSDSLQNHKQVAGRDRESVSIPLVTQAGVCVGALLIVATRGRISRNLRTLDFLDASAPVIADTLCGCQRAEGTWMTRLVRWYASRPKAKRLMAFGFLALAVIVGWMPVTYRLSCSSLIEPVQRRFSVAPHDGLMQTTEVEPGDMVTQGQTIATMDGRQVQWELVGLIAQQHRAGKQHDAFLAAHKTTDALQAELERQRLQSQIDLLEFQQSNLTLKAPISGVVLAGSVDRRENFPVDQGDVLFEIAPLDELRIELQIVADEVTHVRSGMDVELQFAGFGGETFPATITKIRPQSEVRENLNVFIAECHLPNRDGRLRPGMQGYAKIAGDRRSLGWITLHRAWEQVARRMPW